ncbi:MULTISPECIES: AAA family ATPase [Azospirillum]|uniref:AAA family ATPase n=1 Tax=Azospirillum TaxID=191 RepID=UPI000E0C06D6|nr:AAA family ATPase [Azospirillum brasilense]
MAHEMSGEELRRYREQRGMNQQALVGWLNERLNRRYDRAKISRWETGAERIPQNVAGALKTATEPVGIPAAAAVRAAPVVFCAANQKGGVAKTTTCVNVAWLLAGSGRRVLLIDCDPQANATVHLGVDPHERELAKATLTHALKASRPMKEFMTPVCDGAFDLLPSSISLAAADRELLRQPNGTLILRAKIAQLAGQYDFVVLDCPPHLGELTVSVLNAADQLLIPTQTEMLSMMGIPQLFETIAGVRELVNPRLQILGVLPTMYSPRRLQDETVMKELRELAAAEQLHLFSPVKRAADYSKSVMAGRPGLAYNPNSAGAESYREIADALLALAGEEMRHGA